MFKMIVCKRKYMFSSQLTSFFFSLKCADIWFDKSFENKLWLRLKKKKKEEKKDK